MDLMSRQPLQMEIEDNQSLIHPGDKTKPRSLASGEVKKEPQWQTGALNQAFPV
jgi:hypothetical protein